MTYESNVYPSLKFQMSVWSLIHDAT